MKSRRIILALLVTLIIATQVAATQRILFYEVGGTSYSITTNYKIFAEELLKKNFEVASIERGEITKEKLENYDILVMQDTQKALTTNEISSIIWFVLQKGRGLFINGGGNGRANQLTIPFGATIDGGMLIDTSDMIPGLNNRNFFLVTDFNDDPSNNILRAGVSKVGFYQGNGFFISGNAHCVMAGNSDTYSDTGSFAAGNRPCLAVKSLFGGGLVMITSDADMLSDVNINAYNNKKFGLNIIEWLSLSTENISLENSTQSLHLQIKEMRLENRRMNATLAQLQGEKDGALQQLASVSLELLNYQTDLKELQEGMIGPLSRGNWATIILGVCLLGAAYVYSKRSTEAAAVNDSDILNELGYEMGGAPSQGAGDSSKDPLDDDLSDLNI